MPFEKPLDLQMLSTFYHLPMYLVFSRYSLRHLLMLRRGLQAWRGRKTTWQSKSRSLRGRQAEPVRTSPVVDRRPLRSTHRCPLGVLRVLRPRECLESGECWGTATSNLPTQIRWQLYAVPTVWTTVANMTASVRKHTAQHLLLRRPQPRNTIKPRPTQPRQSIYKLQPPRRASWPRPIRRWPILPPAQRNIVVVVQLTKRVHRTSRVRLWQRQQPQMRPHPISRTTVRRRPIVLQRLWYQSPPTRSRRHSSRSRQQQHLRPRGLQVQVEEAGLMLRPLRVHRSPPLKRCRGRQSLTR